MALTMPLTMEDIATLGRCLRVAQTRPGLSTPDHPPADLRGGGTPSLLTPRGTHIVGTLDKLHHVPGIFRQLPDCRLGDDLRQLLPGQNTGGCGQNHGAKDTPVSTQFCHTPRGFLPAGEMAQTTPHSTSYCAHGQCCVGRHLLGINNSPWSISSWSLRAELGRCATARGPPHLADVTGTNEPGAQVIVKCGIKSGSDVY